MKKPLIFSLASGILLFLLLFLLLPITYTYMVTAPTCPPAGALPGSVYNCPAITQDKSGKVLTITTSHGPFITALAKSGGFPRPLNAKHIVAKDVFLAAVVGLFSYEIIDKWAN